MVAKGFSRRDFLRKVASATAVARLPESCPAGGNATASASEANKEKRRNIIFILIDDHRYDAMSFLGHPFVETPNLDAMARAGVYFPNAFVTTSLCSPSRASILTGKYMHNHNVVDNGTRLIPGNTIFPQQLQANGYETAFIGKWHMGGGSDEPRPGFDHWVSFRGQGFYWPAEGRTLNVNGKRVPQKGYITDELTDYAIDWLGKRSGVKPFFMYLSHKAVHGPYEAPPRHSGRYKDVEVNMPESMADTDENYRGKPMWVKNQRNSWHGVDFAYHGRLGSLTDMYKSYCEMLLSVDESVGRVMAWLKEAGLIEETLIIYMGDNGHFWGEHGLIDKRSAYEESMRIPMLAHCPELLKPGTKVKQVVANIDIGPTILEAAGMQPTDPVDGRSFLELATGQMDPTDWRKDLLYEYYWEWSFPQTPTTFALRTNRYKLIQYHGIWDTDELYDIKNDPKETNNLINDPGCRQLARQMREDLYQRLKDTGGLAIPLGHKRGEGMNLRRTDGSKPADFPERMMREVDADR